MTVKGILGRIVDRTLEDVQARRSRVSRRDLEDQATDRSGGRIDFEAAIRRGDGDPVRFICEIKKASPSKGVLRRELDPGELAAIYRDHGASAISVVTEPHFFQGEDGFLGAARPEAGELPLLRKDFHVDELQVLEAAAGEADALLLIAAVLSPTQLKDYLDIARAFGLGHLVEAGDPGEAEVAIRAGARVVGVNNRDLTTFDVDPTRTERVLPVLREADVVSVSESGIQRRPAVTRFEHRGVHAVLVGEALVTSPDPGRTLRSLRGEDEPAESSS